MSTDPAKTEADRRTTAASELFTAELRSGLRDLRRSIHADPELAFEEERTAARLAAALRALGIGEPERIARTGLVARIRGTDRNAPTVAIRGDIDALPIQEATGLPYASKIPGVMHACGHDVHATWAVGAAALLAREPAIGDVLVLLQPAEETAEGALAVLDSGALDGVAAIFGAHVDRRFELGRVVAESGPLAASADNFRVVLQGSGAHGARPHESRDPVVGLGALITALQTIVSRRLDPATPGVVSIGTVSAGTAPNVIPEQAELTGTVRATEAATRDLLLRELRRIAEGTAAVYGLAADVSFQLGPPPIVNPAEQTSWARTAVEEVLGGGALAPLPSLNMGGEDFAYYLESIPGCFLRIGAREAGGEPIPAHTPRFHAAEESIYIGAAVLAQTARVASSALRDRS
jgi:amidohydrolase